MANFLLSLTNPVTGLPDITVENGVVTVVDHSNYGDGTEAGHARANFTDFYKMKFTLPNGQTYLFSSKYPADGNAIAGVPSAGNPTIAYTYNTGDGQYWIHVYTAPTYSSGASYLVANTPYVWYSSKYWKALQNTAGNTPVEGVYWTEITDIDTLPNKYRIAQRVVIYSDAKRTYARRIYNANVINNRIGENWEQLLKDPEYIAACRLFIAINSIPVSMASDNWTAVDATINFTKQVSSLYEV
jgi:hypothetical protein